MIKSIRIGYIFRPMFHMRIRPSPEPLAKQSLERSASESTKPVWPTNVLTTSPRFQSHKSIEKSGELVANNSDTSSMQVTPSTPWSHLAHSPVSNDQIWKRLSPPLNIVLLNPFCKAAWSLIRFCFSCCSRFSAIFLYLLCLREASSRSRSQLLCSPCLAAKCACSTPW